MVVQHEMMLPTTAAVGAAVLETLAYSDVFDYPLRLEELQRYLPIPIELDRLRESLDEGIECICSQDGFYFLEGRRELIDTRLAREAISRPALRRAMQLGRMLGSLPFIRMVALTGSLAVLNSDRNGDLDYMLVTAPGRVWMARGFALLLGRLTALAGYTICPNLIVSEHALAWPEHDLYGAREICQMIPITGMQLYERLRRVNRWTERFLPNAEEPPIDTTAVAGLHGNLRRVLEWPLAGRLGDRIEQWEMSRKIRRFTQQYGFGIETRFDVDVCQGNFLHHGEETRQALRERLARLHVDSPYIESTLELD